jgi:hypothetical protein
MQAPPVLLASRKLATFFEQPERLHSINAIIPVVSALEEASVAPACGMFRSFVMLIETKFEIHR